MSDNYLERRPLTAAVLERRDGTLVAAAAVPTGPARLDVYLSNTVLDEADIPQPADPDVVVVTLGLEQTDGSPISPGTFTGQVTGAQYGTGHRNPSRQCGIISSYRC